MKSNYVFSAIVIAAILIIVVYILSTGAQTINKMPGEKPNWNTTEPAKPELPEFAQKTLEARDRLMTGSSLKDVRTKIDNEYSGRGVGTNTSLPP